MKKMITAMAMAVSLGFTAAAQADTLLDILLSDGDMFDDNQNDFDIVTQAIATCSPELVDGAGNPGAMLTAFLPTDKAFRILVEDVFDVAIKNEAELFGAIASAFGCPTIDTVLKYHVAPATLYAADVLTLESGDMVPNIAMLPLEVSFKGRKGKGQIRLVDNEPMLRNPIVVATDIMADNGVAHVIDRVLLPIAVVTE